MKRIKGSHDYWVLVCDAGWKRYKDMMICGVFASRKEAQECAKDVDGCVARHFIKRCSVEVTFK